jgi:ABC-2 type transport system permease protein
MIRSLFWQLMRKDLRQFRRVYPEKFFDTCFLLFTNATVFGYFMPMLGVSSSYGPFIVVGAIASFGLFDIISHVGELIFDIEGDRTITFKLAMPVPASVVFAQLAIRWGLNSILLTTPLFLIGKLILWKTFDLTQINLWKLLIIFPTVSLFFGTFSLWLAGIIKKMINLSTLFLRFINPMFMFGGYFFTWQDSFALSPIIGYAILLDPMIYVMEGMRGACIGQEGYLPFWACFFALWGFIFVMGTHAISSLKKRLDTI